MSFFTLKNCPFCQAKLEFSVVGDFPGIGMGYCSSCHGTPMFCGECGTTAIVAQRGGVGCPNCGNNHGATCEIPYAEL